MPNDCCCQLFGRLTGMSLASAVYRDERGTDNRSTEDLKSSMTVEQFIADLEKLVDAVCTRIGQNKVAIMNKEARVVAARAQRAARSCHAP